MNVLERIKTFDFSKRLSFSLKPFTVDREGYHTESYSSDEKAKEELIKLAKIGQRMQWVSVSERLPEEGQKVLLNDVNGCTSCGWLKKDGISWSNYGDCGELTRNFNFITHWMPIPP